MIPIANLSHAEFMNQYFIERSNRLILNENYIFNKICRTCNTSCILNLEDLCLFKSWTKDFTKDCEYTLIKNTSDQIIFNENSDPIDFLVEDLSEYLEIISKMKIVKLQIANCYCENLQKFAFSLLSLKSLQDNIVSIELGLINYSSILFVLKIGCSCPNIKEVNLAYINFDLYDEDLIQEMKRLIFKLEIIPKIFKTSNKYASSLYF